MIDWGRVAELRDEIGDDGFDDVVDLFIEETDEVVAGLAALSGGADIEKALHFLKGSALNLGFTDLATLCQAGERQAAAGAAQAVDRERLGQVYAETRRIFLGRLRRSAA
ncbi:Hpt domain-containing protein [Aliigemmobacter aestuarii]|uniref:Hpt domain-containing protein n=1 Tax=Aliigemmobacter aestuarii TaxID=1445661 RepID=A0A4V3V0V7_9RHOB|nr:Hpt domain-containing protein [Gemmobacter aestuarii]THD85462.1 Hpt domain-containing protein [Gemmobacter aestuarii]